MALLALTQTSSGSSFSLDEKNVLKIYNNGSKNIVEYLDVVKGLKKQMEVDETPAAIFALADNMVSTTLGGATIYLNADRVTTVDELNSLAVVKYDEGTELSVTLNLDVDKSTFEAGIPNPSYRIYKALLSQSGTGDPTAIVFENTLGSISFSRSSAGEFLITGSSLFVTNKTFASFDLNWAVVNDEKTALKRIADTSTIDLVIQDSGDSEIDGFTGGLEIRVYN